MSSKEKNNLAVVILAAGKGTRMKSNLPKVLHKVNDKPMISHVIQRALDLKANKIISIIGYKHKLVEESLSNEKTDFVIQEQQLGTGHAVLQCANQLSNFEGSILVLSGDVPTITCKTLKALLKTHQNSKTKATILSALVDDASGYGRVIRNNDGTLNRIVEHKDANSNELLIKEMNAGIYVFDCKTLFKLLPSVGNNNNQSEYYLPDVLSLIINNGDNVAIEKTDDIDEIQGVNNIQQLKVLNEKFNV